MTTIIARLPAKQERCSNSFCGVCFCLWRVIIAGLTDYETRDLNDEINKLLREKRHWENQIVALGGANYRRNVAMLDDDGKEVPGTKGYKCVLHTPLKVSC